VVLAAGLAAAAPDDDKVTLNFQDAEALSVLEFYAHVTGKAFLPEDDMKVRLSVIAPAPVSRRTALDLLDTVLALKGYSLVERDDYFKVVKKQQATHEALRPADESTPDDRFVTEIIDLRFVDAAGIQNEIRQLLTPEGTLLVNRPLNLLIATDTAISLQRIRRLVASIDVPARALVTRAYPIRYAAPDKLEPLLREVLLRDPDPTARPVISLSQEARQLIATGLPTFHEQLRRVLDQVDVRLRQVLIEVRIVEVSLDDSTRLGLEWQWKDKVTTIEQDLDHVNATTLLGGLTGMKYSIVNANDYKVLVDSFAQSQNAEILSNPHLVTVDGKEARLQVGEQIPILREQRLDTQNNPIRTFDQQRVGISTAVTPRIAGDGDVLLQVRQEVSDVISVDTQSFTSTIGQRVAETNVTVKDGHTLVIGGLIRDENKTTETGVPVLRNIPYLGAIFRRRTTEPTKTELVIFITPHVLDGAADADRATDQQQEKHPRTLDVSGDEFKL
jgi:general secretion pathway protein D